MYHEYYAFQHMPFDNTPDPRFFFAGEGHREALAAIEYAIRMRKGYVLVTGDIGTGKTMVGRTMVHRLGEHVEILILLHGHRRPAELLRQVLRALDTPYDEDDDHALLLERLQEDLLTQQDTQRPVVLFIDEAQTLSDQALDEIRLLSNFDTSTTKLLQVVLVGQPELRRRIASPRMAPLRQRIILAKELKALTLQDTAAYIMHRLRTGSADPDHVKVAFMLPAVHEIYEHARGIPRVINSICDNCLLLGFVRETRQITSSMVKRVVDDMVPQFEETPMDDVEHESPRLTLAGSM